MHRIICPANSAALARPALDWSQLSAPRSSSLPCRHAGIRSSIYGPLAVLFPFTAGLVKRLASVFPDPPLSNVMKVQARGWALGHSQGQRLTGSWSQSGVSA